MGASDNSANNAALRKWAEQHPKSAEQTAKDGAEYSAYAAGVDAAAAKNGGIGVGGSLAPGERLTDKPVLGGPDSTAVIRQSPGGLEGETDEQRRVREGMLADKRTRDALPGQGTKAAPDLADAAIASQVRNGLLKDRFASTGRRGSFLSGAMGDVTAPPKAKSILGGF